MAPLQAALPLAQVHGPPERIGEDLHLDVAGRRDEPLQEQGVVAERGRSLPAGPDQRLLHLRGGLHQPHPLATPARRRLEQDREPDLIGRGGDLPVRHAPLGPPGDGRDAGGGHRRLGPDLVPHQLDGVRGRSHEHQAGGGGRPGELGVLGQEAVAGMHRLGAGGPRRGEDPLDVHVAVLGRRRTDPDGHVGLPHMRGARVGVAVDGDGTDAETPQRADDADGDLPAVGHQHRGEHGAHIRKTP